MVAVDLHAEEMRATWDYWSQAYDRGEGIGFATPGMGAAWLADMGRLFGHPAADPTAPRLRILDLASGTGQLTLTLARLGHHVQALDLSPAMLRAAEAKAGALGLPVSFHRGEAHALPFADGSFDAVVSKMLLWTLYDPESAVVEWRRVTAPGGRVMGIDALWFGRQTVAEHVAWPAYRCWVALVQARDRLRLRLRRGAFPGPPPPPRPSSEQPPGRRWTSTDPIVGIFTASGDERPSLDWLTSVNQRIRLEQGPLRCQVRRQKPFFVVTAVRPGSAEPGGGTSIVG